MKKALSILAAAMLVPLLSSSASAQGAAEAYSANAVGVVKYKIPAGGKMTCVALPLNPLGDSGEWVWPETTLAGQLDNGSTAFFWDGYAWQPSTKSRWGWDGVGADKVIAPGEAFFIQSASTLQDDKEISLLGELPTEESEEYLVRGKGNLDTRGVTMYPVTTDFASSSLASNLVSGSTVYFWDGRAWQPSTKSRWGWDGVGASTNVFVGQGVFVQSAGTVENQPIPIPRPFDWEN